MTESQKTPVVVFDLDGTLVDTDEANGLAYQRAVQEITGIQLPLDGCRITRETIRQNLGMDNETISRIAACKELIFPNYLNTTIPLPALQIVRHLTGSHVVLLTLARRNRAISVLDYHNARSYFNSMYFKEDYGGLSKFEFLRTQLLYNLSDIILFENEQEMIKEAEEQGIPPRNIYKQY